MTAIVTADQLVSGLAARIVNGLDADYEGDNKLLKDAMVSRKFFTPSDSGGGGQEVYIQAFGAAGDGITDDTDAFQTAIDSFGGKGGVIRAIGKFRIARTLNVARNVFIVGNFVMPSGSETTPEHPFTDYTLITSGALVVDSSATIKLGPGAGLESLLIYRYGMTFPVTDTSSYAGTAITAAGNDNSVRKCFITGFDIAYHSYLAGRHTLEYLQLDNRNGIDILECYDVTYISNCHAWPFASFSVDSANDALKHIRPGIAFKLYSRVDWGKVTNCFAYGYKTGFLMDTVHNVTLTGCGADNAFDNGPAHVGSVGFHITGASADIQLIGCQAAAQELAGLLVDNGATDSKLTTNVTNFTSWGVGQQFIKVVSGNIIIANSNLYNMLNATGKGAISVTNSTSKILVSGTSIRNIGANYVVDCPATNNVELRDITVEGWAGTDNPIGTKLVTNVLTGDNRLDIPLTAANVFRIANGSNFGYIAWGYKGKEITLIFDGVSTVYNRPETGYTTGNILLTSSPVFVSQAGYVLRLIHDGRTWVEVSRSPAADAGTGTAGVGSINGLTGAVTLKTINGQILTGTGDITISTTATGVASINGQTGAVTLKTINGQTLHGTGAVTGLTSGSTSTGFINYNGTTATAGQWHGGSQASSGTTRLTYNGRLVANVMVAEAISAVRSGGFATVNLAASESPSVYGHLTFQSDNNMLIGTVGSGSRISFTPQGTYIMGIYNTHVVIPPGYPLLVGYTSSQSTTYRLQVNSQIFATSSTIATSDKRYKENIVELTNALTLVNKLNPVQFDWKKHPVHEFPKGKTVGFIAQDVVEALSGTDYVDSIVKPNQCELPDGTKEEFLGIAEGNLIALLTSAVKELTSKVELLTNRVRQLELGTL